MDKEAKEVMATGDMDPAPMTREEAKRILRRLELDAYSAIVTAFRAQGDVDKSKKSILNELSNHLSISTERHRAEVRRVVNDDRLNAVAECMHGTGTSAEWSIEGRRLVSLMPRLVPQTVFTAKASAAASQAVESNQKLPLKTEIEVLPLPTKPKTLPPKPDRHDSKDEKTKINLLNDNLASKQDDKTKKKKKPNILYSKPSPIALNKTLTNPFKPSTTPSSLKPMIKSNSLKYSASYSVSRASTSLSSPVKYSPKPIILQRSPTKSHPNLSRPPSIQLQSLSSSNVNTPLTSLSSVSGSKSDSSLNLIQSPMIKVVSNSLQNNINSTSAINTLHSGSITQKIKFKTPLPKPKVKSTKFKPMVPLQRSGLLSSSSQNADSVVLGSSSSVTVAPMSPGRSGSTQGVSVKVVQVAKSGVSSTLSSSLLSNKPVVVVSSNKNPSQRVLAFSTVANSVNHQIKMSSTSLASSVTSSVPKGALTSKSMPLATGFKMIAVTTVVPGTTQVKTVYIATPIMSLTKTVSQTTATSITTPAAQSGKHVPSSLASNLQSVVARSINAAVLNQTGKSLGLHNLPSTAISTSAASLALSGKPSNLVSSAKGLGSLKTTLSGGSQSLKLFTAITKNRTALNVTNTMKTAPLLPSTSLLSSNIGHQRVGNIQIKSTDIPSHRNDKQQVLNVTHEVPPNMLTNNFLNIGSATTNSLNTNNSEQVSDPGLPTALTLNVNNFDEDVSSTLNLLNDNNITTEQITASATAETDDMAFLNAGEKFLEQLSAKMTGTSPDSLTKTESFIFPANLSIGLANEALNQTHNVYELSKEHGIEALSGVQLKQPDVVTKDTNYLINQKAPGLHNIGLVTPKSSNTLSNNISLVNARFNLAASNLNNGTYPQVKGTLNTLSSMPAVNNLSVSKSSFQKADINRTVLNYPNITKVGGKTDVLNVHSDNSLNTVGFINVGSTLTIDNTPSNMGLKLTSSPQLSNKLQMSIPGSSKLNISPVLVNNVNSNSSTNNELFTQISKTPVNSLIPFSTINSRHTNVSPIEPTRVSIGANSLNQALNGPEVNQNIENLNGKKRKLSDTSKHPSRTQASWIRGAANLLARVSRFRGSNKQKGEMNAASWFTKPVDQNDAPGYYRIIKNPMDFGRIKRKLEDGEYESYPNFYDDMMLIKNNCYIYNPEGHVTRKDCDDVFSFFEVEYRKLLDRWEKHHVSPQKKLKITPEDGVDVS